MRVLMTDEKKDLTGLFQTDSENSENFLNHSTPPLDTDPPSEQSPSSLNHQSDPEFLSQLQVQEKIDTDHPSIPASFPFSVLIEGQLLETEKTKLIEMITGEQLGIREIDLEMQLAQDRILIPRISEYAAIVIVQALRATRARIQVGPASSLIEPSDHSLLEKPKEKEEPLKIVKNKNESLYPADLLPITTGHTIAELEPFITLDTVTASGSLKTYQAEIERSVEFDAMLEKLTKSIKYKAYQKKADGIIFLKFQLDKLTSPTNYRLVVSGSIIKKKQNETEHP